MKTLTTKIISPADIGSIASSVGLHAMMDRSIAALEEAFEAHDDVRFEIPARAGFSYTQPEPGLIEWMPAMARGSHALMKLVAYHPGNPVSRNLPTILSTFALLDTGSGHVLAIADGTFLTALRTGAASAVATDMCTRHERLSCGVIGCGAQAVTQLHGLSRMRDLDVVLYWDSDPAARASFPGRVATVLPQNVKLREAPVSVIVPNVDVLVTATSIDIDAGPLFADCETRPHLHINAVGSDFPGKVEVPVELLRRAVVIPDFHSQAVNEGECQQLEVDQIGPELHQLVKTPSRDYAERLTVFDSTGWALEDLVAMDLLLEWAQEFGVGEDVSLEHLPADPKNPYRLASSTRMPMSSHGLAGLAKPARD